MNSFYTQDAVGILVGARRAAGGLGGGAGAASGVWGLPVAGAGRGGESGMRAGMMERGFCRYLRDRIRRCKIFRGQLADFYFLAHPTELFFSLESTPLGRVVQGWVRGRVSLLGRRRSGVFTPHFSYRLFV